jgi:hypothetical protein
MVDQHNCGACGHDCGEDTCSAGQCGAYDLYTAAVGKDIVSLASDGTFIYWSEIDTADSKFSAIARMRIDKTSAPASFVSVEAHSVVTDGMELFWWGQTSGQIQKSLVTISMVQNLFAQTNMPAELHLEGSEVLWSDNGSSRIYSGSKSGTPPAVFAVAQGLQSQHFGVDAGYVYWSTGSAINKRKRPLSGMDSPLSVGPADMAVNVLADPDPTNGYVYYATSAVNGGVFRLKKDGSTISSNALFVSTNYTDALLMDGAYLYWTNFSSGACTGGGSLGAKSFTTGAQKSLAPLTGCGAITQDAGAIYFVDAGTIRRVVKPVP